jgi:hypothetical protein
MVRDLLKGDHLLVVLRYDPLDTAAVLAPEAVPEALEPLAERRVLVRPLLEEPTGPLDPLLRERADEGCGVDRVQEVVRDDVVRERGAVREPNGGAR